MKQHRPGVRKRTLVAALAVLALLVVVVVIVRRPAPSAALAPDRSGALVADPLARAPREGTGAPEQGTGPVAFRFAGDTFTLRGTVVDSGQGAIPAARVSARLTGGAAGPAARGSIAAKLDGQGGYQLALPAGDYVLTATADGYASTTESLRLFAGAVKDLKLDPESSIVGVVTQSVAQADATGRTAEGTALAVAGAEVWAAAPGALDSTPAGRAFSDAAGRFTITGLAGGPYLVRARKGRLAGEQRLRLAVGELERRVDLSLDAGLLVSGRVLREGGGPVANAALTAVAGKNFLQATGARLTAVSAGDGTFVIEGLFPGVHQLMVRAPGFSVRHQGLQLSDRDLRDVDITLTAGSVLAGRVLDGTGAPVAGARVSSAVERGTGMGWTGVFQNQISDQAGRFRFEDLAGKVSLRAEHPRFGAALHGPEVIAGGAAREIDLHLEGGSSFSGTVRDAGGQPAPGVSVSARFEHLPPPWFMTETYTDGQGRYTVAGAPAGRVFVSAYRRSGPPANMRPVQKSQERTVEMVKGADLQNIDLSLPAGGGTLAGQVLLPDGQPALGALVRATPGLRSHPGKAPHRTSVAADGTFVLEDVDAVAHALWAEHPGYAEAELKGVVPGAAALVLRLRPAAMLAGTVRTRDGQPVRDFDLLIGPSPDGGPGHATELPSVKVHDRAGRFEASGLAPGAYQVTVRTISGAAATVPAVLGEGERKDDVRVVVADAVAIAGRVLDDESGRPLPGVVVSAMMGMSTTAGETSSGPDGSFRLEGLAPGSKLRLMFRGPASGQLPDREDVTVPAQASQATLDFGVVRLLRGSWGERTSSTAVSLGFRHARQVGGVVITEVRPGSPAERAGLRPGERWLALGQRPIGEVAHDGRLYLLTQSPSPLELQIGGGTAGPRTVTLVASARK